MSTRYTASYLPAAGGGGSDTPINPDVGALALTGYAPTVVQTVNQVLRPGVGSITITGYAPTVTQSVTTTLRPDVGSVTLTGYAPTIAQTRLQFIEPDAGILTITGYAPTVTQEAASPSLTPDVGLLTITGYAPTVTQSAPVTKIGGDDVPRPDEERIEVWERPAKTRRDESLDKVIREAYAKATGQPAKVPAPAPVLAEPEYADEEEDDLEILLLSL